MSKGEISRRVRSAVTLEKKIKIIELIENGWKLMDVVKEFKLPRSTIQGIVKQKNEIKEVVENCLPLTATKVSRTRSVLITRMETLLSIWIADQNHRNIPVTTKTIMKKARSLFSDLKAEHGGEEVFSASPGWFDRFRKRSNFRSLNSADVEAIREVRSAVTLEKKIKIIKHIENGCKFTDVGKKIKLPRSTKTKSGRARNAVTLEKKIKIIELIENGCELMDVKKEFKLPRSTIQGIVKQKNEIKKFAENCLPFTATRVSRTKSVLITRMETLLSMWIADQNLHNIPVTPKIIMHKARSLFSDLKAEHGGEEVFAASPGWFHRFRKRIKFHSNTIVGELYSADVEEIEKYQAVESPLKAHDEPLIKEESKEIENYQDIESLLEVHDVPLIKEEPEEIVKYQDTEDPLKSHGVPLIKEEPEEINCDNNKSICQDMDVEQIPSQKQLTVKVLEKVFFLQNQCLKLLEENDDNYERISAVKRGSSKLFEVYRRILFNKRKEE